MEARRCVEPDAVDLANLTAESDCRI